MGFLWRCSCNPASCAWQPQKPSYLQRWTQAWVPWEPSYLSRLKPGGPPWHSFSFPCESGLKQWPCLYVTKCELPLLGLSFYIEKSATWCFFLHFPPNKSNIAVYCDEETDLGLTICCTQIQRGVDVYPASSLTAPWLISLALHLYRGYCSWFTVMCASAYGTGRRLRMVFYS
jgi:hypothetical protein